MGLLSATDNLGKTCFSERTVKKKEEKKRKKIRRINFFCEQLKPKELMHVLPEKRQQLPVLSLIYNIHFHSELGPSFPSDSSH